MPDAGQLPPLGLGRTLPDRGGGVRIPAYPPPGTLQTLRDTMQIPYTVISGRVFLYPETGIRETLGKNYRPAESPF